MNKPVQLYVILNKETNKISITRYVNSEMLYILNVNNRKAQRLLNESNIIELETYTIYKVFDLDFGSRGGKRYKKENDW